MSEAMQVKSVRLPAELWERMDAVATGLGLTRSDVHRRLLEHALSDFEREIAGAGGALGGVAALARLMPRGEGGL